MKLNKRMLHQQRQQLDNKLKAWRSVSQIPRPRSGWLKAVREALGLTTRQLAALLGTNNAAIVRMEKRETEGKVTLEAISRAAKTMGCKLVYAIVPDESLEHIVDSKAREAARSLLNSVSHTMRLENQEVADSAFQAQLESLSQELKARLDPALWRTRT